jgi:hypothetical protein
VTDEIEEIPADREPKSTEPDSTVSVDADQGAQVGSGDEATLASDGGALFNALLARYRPAYLVITRMEEVGGFLLVVGSVLFFGGILAVAAGVDEVFGVFTSIFGGAALSLALVLKPLASVMRAILDQAVFVAPGLDDTDRVRLAFQAGGEPPPV